MTVFLKNILKFALVSITAYLLLLILFAFFAPIGINKNQNYNHNYYGFNKARLTEVKQFKNIDILFLGSSHAYRGFDTRIFNENGYKTFNLGSSSQSPIQTKLLLDRYLTRLNPKLVVWELTPSALASDGVESALDLISNDNIDLGSLKMALYINNLRIYNTLFIACISEIIKTNRQKPEENHNKKDTYVKGGFVEKKLKFYEPKPIESEKKAFNPNKKQLNIVNDVITLLKKNEIKYIMVSTPVTKDRTDLYNNLNAFHEYMASLGQYYNFNKIVSLKDTMHFYDSHHLNQNGVEIFNNEILKMLKYKELN